MKGVVTPDGTATRLMECGDLSPLWEFGNSHIARTCEQTVHETADRSRRWRSEIPKAVTSPRTPDPKFRRFIGPA